MLSDARPPSPFWPSIVILIAASVVYCAPLFTNLDSYGRQDWDQFTFRYETARVALLRDLQWPVWNPYANGGTALLAHPHSPVFSPWYLVTLVLGAPMGLRVQVVLFMALGSIGMAALMRQFGAGRVAGLTAGVVMMMSAHYALHITEGHLEWTALGAMPWVVLGLWRAQALSLTGVGRRSHIRGSIHLRPLPGIHVAEHMHVGRTTRRGLRRGAGDLCGPVLRATVHFLNLRSTP